MPKTNQNDGCNPNDDLVDRLMLALADPLRRRILTSLMHKPGSASTLSAEYGLPLGNVSYHLSTVLFKKCGVVRIVERNPRRGAEEKVFGLNPEAFIGAIKWPAIPASMRSGLHGAAMDSFLRAAIASMEAEADESRVPSVYVMQPITVDRDGQLEVTAAVEDLESTVRAVAARCAALNSAELMQMVVGGAAFEAAPGQKARKRAR